MPISLHVATQAIRLRRSGSSLNTLRVTLWFVTAIHLDTLNSDLTPLPQVDIIADYRIVSAQREGWSLGLPPRQPLKALEGG